LSSSNISEGVAQRRLPSGNLQSLKFSSSSRFRARSVLYASASVAALTWRIPSSLSGSPVTLPCLFFPKRRQLRSDSTCAKDLPSTVSAHSRSLSCLRQLGCDLLLLTYQYGPLTSKDKIYPAAHVASLPALHAPPVHVPSALALPASHAAALFAALPASECHSLGRPFDLQIPICDDHLEH